MVNRKAVGKRGEDFACQLLRAKGYRILERNYRCRSGEIDIIAAQGECLVFCEVRTRTSCGPILPEETVDRCKQSRLVRASRHYLQGLQRRGNELKPCRFDVITLTYDGSRAKVKHIMDAFSEADVCGDVPGAV
jgi:putative endonuclease